MCDFLDFELSDDERADTGVADTGQTGEVALGPSSRPCTVQELAAALLREDDDLENIPGERADAASPEPAPAAPAAPPEHAPAAPAHPPRLRRIAAPRSARGRAELEAGPEALATLMTLSLCYAMPVPREAKAEQGLVPAPLSHTSLEPSPEDKPDASAGRRGDGATRKRRADERAMQEARGLKHDQKILTVAWAEERYWKGRVIVRMLAADGEATCGLPKRGVTRPPITRDQAALAEALLDKAAKRAVLISASKRNMATASPAFWAFVCALEAFARMNAGGYVVPSERAAHVRSWAGLEETYEEIKRCEENVREDRYGLSMTHRFRPGYTGTDPIVRRSTGSHNFGNAEDKRKKIACLDMLLRGAGDQGLHFDIKLLKPPTIIEHDTPSRSLYTGHQTAAEERWNAKFAAKAAARKAAK
jgi:hypothetical protein